MKSTSDEVRTDALLASSFTTSQASRITGASARMLAHWDRIGLIHPTARRASGKGSKRLYSFSDLIVIRTIHQLRQANCPLSRIHSAVKALRSRRPETCSSEALAELTLVTNGKSVLLLDSNKQLLDVLTRQVMWCVPLGQLILDTSQRVGNSEIGWKEPVVVRGRHFQLVVQREPSQNTFVARCSGMRGVLHRSESPSEAISRAKEAIASVLEFETLNRPRRQRASQSPQKGITA
jgi:DNA-binding transcriptional MerR regulator/predicted RNase H-like HicB family nuclease